MRHSNQPFVAAVVALLLANAFCPAESAEAFPSVAERIVRALDARLAQEQWRLEKLVALKSRGFASWREVAEQEVAIKSLQAYRQSAGEFATFCTAIQRRVPTAFMRVDSYASEMKPPADMNAAWVEAKHRIATAKTVATGELQLAEAAARRQALLLESYRELHAKKLAGDSEFKRAQDDAQAAQEFVEQLKAKHQPLKTVVQHGVDAKIADVDLRPDSLPLRLCENASAVQRLIALRLNRCEAVARAIAATAKLEMLKTLDERLASVRQATSSGRREREFLKLDIELKRSEALAAKERAEILALEEQCVVVRFLDQRGAIAKTAFKPEADLIASETEMPVAFDPSAFVAAASSSQLVDATYAFSRPRYSNFESRDPRLAATPDVTLFTSLPRVPEYDATTRGRKETSSAPSPYRFPAYQDYYQFGIRRPDLSPIESKATPYGGPWYIPGAPTNFR
jgi:hypothetical protein